MQRSNSFESEDEEEQEKNEEENKEGTNQKKDLEKMEESKQEGRVGVDAEIEERLKKDAVRSVLLFIVLALFLQSFTCDIL